MIVAWIGFGGHVHHAESIRRGLADLGITLKTCHEHLGADIKWSVENARNLLEECDAVYLPSNYAVEDAKGTNRLSQAWSMKKAVVAMPMPSYLRHTHHGENCLMVNNHGEAVQAFTVLRDDPILRKSLGDRGYSNSFVFHPHGVVNKFIDALRKDGLSWVLGDKFLQVVIPHYQPRIDYLKLAISSALKSVGPARDILVVSSSKENPIPALQETFPKGVRYYWHPERLTFSQANNYGIENANTKTTHFLLLNDDTIVGSQAIGRMFDEIGDRQILLNPYSNCDKGWLHDDKILAAVELGGNSLVSPSTEYLDLHPGMSIEETQGFDEAIRLVDQRKEFDGSEVKEAPFCAFYATLIPKVIVDKVGLLNEAYKNGGEDLCYSNRAKRFGFETFFSKKCWVFHFGGRSRRFSESQNFLTHHEEDQYNNQMVIKNWGKDGRKKRVAIYTGPSWAHDNDWCLDTYKDIGIGGSETCAARLAMEFAANGHYVVMYGSHEMKEQHGVQLCPWNLFNPLQEYFDIFIASRSLDSIDLRLRAKTVLVWVHDVHLMSGQKISAFHLSRVDKFIALSPWHKEYVKHYHGIPDEKIEIIPNGVNVEFFK